MVKKIAVNKKYEHDPFYRYMMETPVIASVKTDYAITNINNIANNLNRNVDLLVKYLQLQLHSKCKYNKDTKAFIISTKITDIQIIDIIYMFCEELVLCKTCDNPETTIEINKNDIFLVCGSCGNTDKCKINNDKLKKYVILNC